jgi:hypothetical protein
MLDFCELAALFASSERPVAHLRTKPDNVQICSALQRNHARQARSFHLAMQRAASRAIAPLSPMSNKGKNRKASEVGSRIVASPKAPHGPSPSKIELHPWKSPHQYSRHRESVTAFLVRPSSRPHGDHVIRRDSKHRRWRWRRRRRHARPRSLRRRARPQRLRADRVAFFLDAL